jgi:hypothetical protein
LKLKQLKAFFARTWLFQRCPGFGSHTTQKWRPLKPVG